MTSKITKKQKLRNNEYYNTQEMFDDLYKKSKEKENYRFYKLMDLITNEENIKLAYRNIKKNKGSKTSGTNGKTIEDIAGKTDKEIIAYIKNRLNNYKPHKVKRVMIPKQNGKLRPLGIPTIEDRIIQQCILQILEPICEAKFFKHSYGFRPNRSTHHAIARCHHLIHKNKLHYVVDIDIKGFFDNVNHGKLLKQMWTLGIQDKQLLKIISKMLKAPIEGEGIPQKGTPQGGILSPLLSNIVLNELDWWVSNQWENFKTKREYAKDNKYRALKTTKMKEVFLVRYADDFKIFCKDYKTAKKMFHATQMWLNERLHLEISEEKSKIVNLNKNYSEYLGFKMKVRDKKNGKVVKSHLSDKSKEKVIKKIEEQIDKIQIKNNSKEVSRYNSIVLGVHNYYKIATHVSKDFSEISYKLSKTLYNKTKIIRTKTGNKSPCYEKFYGRYNSKTIYIQEIAMFPIDGIKTKPPLNFKQEICNYTEEGREAIHKKLKNISPSTIVHLMENPIQTESIEYNDNRISLYVGQGGICGISGKILEIGEMECHHKVMRRDKGTDEYNNLILLSKDVHKLIHAKEPEIINKYISRVNLNPIQIKKLNKLRILVGNSEILI